MNTDIENQRLIGKRELLRLVGISYSSVFERMRRGDFPMSIRIGSRVFWRWTEVEKWLDELPRSEYAPPRKSRDQRSGGDR